MMQSDFIIYYSKEAQIDLLEAVKWYNNINPTLGKILKKEIRQVEKKLNQTLHLLLLNIKM